MSEPAPDVQRQLPRLRSTPLHKSVQDEIRQLIVRDGLRGGDPLKPEAELARQFGVSRNSVREAVKALESTGVVETRRGSGVYVRDFSFTPLLEQLPYGLMQSPGALADLVGLRKTLEAALIGDAIAALKPEHAQALRELLATMRERAERGEDLHEQDRAFHQLLFVDLGNAMLLEVFDLFWVAYHQATLTVPHRDAEAIIGDHARIADAVLAKDADTARQAVIAHYRGIEDRVAQQIARSTDS